MEWRTDFENAPTGGVRIVPVGNKGATRVVRSKEWVWCLSKSGEVISTYWIADEGRWNGFSDKSPPVAWLTIPDHPLIAEARANSMQEALI